MIGLCHGPPPGRYNRRRPPSPYGNDRTPPPSSHAGIDMRKPYARFNRARLVKSVARIICRVHENMLKKSPRLPSQGALPLASFASVRSLIRAGVTNSCAVAKDFILTSWRYAFSGQDAIRRLGLLEQMVPPWQESQLSLLLRLWLPAFPSLEDYDYNVM